MKFNIKVCEKCSNFRRQEDGEAWCQIKSDGGTAMFQVFIGAYKNNGKWDKKNENYVGVPEECKYILEHMIS